MEGGGEGDLGRGAGGEGGGRWVGEGVRQRARGQEERAGEGNRG